MDSQNAEVRLSGVNWYGFETRTEVAQGLWAQDYRRILQTVKSNGYNVIRMPFSNQMVEHPIIPQNISFTNGTGAINTDLRGLDSLQVLDKIIAYAGQLGLHIILDNHRSSAGSSTETGLWYTSAYPESAWIADWKALASRYYNNSTVIGVDLRNEPHDAGNGGSCWGCGTIANDWRLAAQRGGNAVLSVNPNLLIFVEGTDCFNGDCDWWGGNLEGAKSAPVQLSAANRLVYSAHDYGPNLFVQTWFNSTTSYSSLTSVWTKFWGYLSLTRAAPVWVGEFGTTNNAADIKSNSPGSQGQWFQSLIAYLQETGMSWTYWALDGEDSYGLLDNNYDATPASALKQSLLSSIQSSTGGGGTIAAPAAPTNLSVTAVSSSQINLSWTPSSTAGATYNVYASPVSSFTPAPATQVASGLTATTFMQNGLSGSTTYYYLVTAVVAGLESAPSNRANATTKANTGGGSSCNVGYSIVNQWNAGFTADIAIKNTGASSIGSWTLTWRWPGNQQIQQSWNGNYTQNGAAVSLVNTSWNGAIAPGGSVTGIGFNASYSGANATPSAIALNGSVCSSGGNTTSSAPTAPANLSASASSSSRINLTWTASTTGGVTYSVYASTNSGFTPSVSTRAASGLTATSFASQNLPAATTYYYAVTAVNAAGESAPTAKVSAKTQATVPIPPNPPSGLTGHAVSSTQINLSWQSSSTSNVTYDVYGSTKSGFTPAAANRIASGLSGTTFQNTGLAPSTAYYYVVTALNSAGESTPTTPVSATTNAAGGNSSACHISYVNQSDWKTGFTGAISISNTGSVAINGWRLSWTWAGNQQLTNAWNAAGAQSGRGVTLASESYNVVIPPGATLTGIGFNANYSGTNAAPTAFSLNGTLCK